MKYNIGAARAADGQATRRQIEEFYKNNPFAKRHECAKALGLSLVTVSRHFKALRARHMAQSLTETA
jgi:predicted ArsR family transcriptional regulator